MRKLKNFPINIVKRISGHYNKAFHAKLFTLFASSESEIAALARAFPKHYDYCFCFITDDQGQWFLDQAGIERVRKYILRQAAVSPKRIFHYYQRWLKDWARYQKINRGLAELKLTRLNDEDFYIKFKEYYELYLKVGGVAYICDAFMSTGETDWLQEFIKKAVAKTYNNQKVDNLVSELLSPVHLSFVLEEEFELLQVAHQICRRYSTRLPELVKLSPAVVSLLKKHEQKFYWMRNNYYNVEYYGVSEIYRRVRVIIKKYRSLPSLSAAVQQKKQHIQEQKIKRALAIRSINLPTKIKNIISVANLFSKWKDTRKSGVYMGMSVFDKFLGELARRTGYSKKDTTFIIFDEVADLLAGRRDFKKIAKERKEKLFFAVKPDSYFIFSGGKSNRYWRYLSHAPTAKFRQMKGVVACKGIAQGRVRVIRKTGEMESFKVGEILVTNNTTPEFVPIMKKAAAILTEQGGITSHAAVISRELNKPCIIGLHGITAALHNGDKINVDADQGLVKIAK